MKIKYITNTVGQDTGICSNRGVRLGALPIASLDEDVVQGNVADVHTGTRVSNAFPRLASVLEGFVDDLEQLPLRRVHGFHLVIGDAKEGIVEQARVLFYEKAAFRACRARAVLIWVMICFGGEPGLIELPPAVLVVSQQLPQPGRATHATGPAAAY